MVRLTFKDRLRRWFSRTFRGRELVTVIRMNPAFGCPRWMCFRDGEDAVGAVMDSLAVEFAEGEFVREAHVELDLPYGWRREYFSMKANMNEILDDILDELSHPLTRVGDRLVITVGRYTADESIVIEITEMDRAELEALRPWGAKAPRPGI